MLNIGKKPTVGDFPRGIEVNIFDFDGDLYNKELQVRFLKFIREDKKFDSLDALISAIRNDEAVCRQWMTP
jgi:riboflavin kinase/FMN adenylyltransferase